MAPTRCPVCSSPHAAACPGQRASTSTPVDIAREASTGMARKTYQFEQDGRTVRLNLNDTDAERLGVTDKAVADRDAPATAPKAAKAPANKARAPRANKATSSEK